MILPTIRLRHGAVEIIDQTLLPGQYRVVRLESLDAICEAIRVLRIRGAPALGVAAAYGVLVALAERWPEAGGDGAMFDDGLGEADGAGVDVSGGPEAAVVSTDGLSAVVGVEEVRRAVRAAAIAIRRTRPTAVNLGWALDRMLAVADAGEGGITGVGESLGDAAGLVRRLVSEAVAIYHEDIEMCRKLGRTGAQLLPDGARVLTHCNTGGLATSGYGTALGVVFSAVENGRRIEVFADETRPLLQGGRLTAWECERRGIPVTVLCDGAAASLLSSGRIDGVIVGADRIAANGDTANKVGTLAVAVLARWADVPFYVAAPGSTIDASLSDGSGIPIELRAADEVIRFAGVSSAPDGAVVYNPAFDVTPAGLISAIITETGVIRPPYRFGTAPE